MVFTVAQGGNEKGECPNTELKEVKKRKRDRSSRMARTILALLETEAVISTHKNSQNCLKVLQLSGKTSAAPGQRGDIMAQISVDTFHREGVLFVVDIEDMFPWKDHVQIPAVSVGAVMFRRRRCVYHTLDCPGHFVSAHNMAHNLPRFPAHHRDNVDIFPCFCPGFVL